MKYAVILKYFDPDSVVVGTTTGVRIDRLDMTKLGGLLDHAPKSDSDWDILARNLDAEHPGWDDDNSVEGKKVPSAKFWSKIQSVAIQTEISERAKTDKFVGNFYNYLIMNGSDITFGSERTEAAARYLSGEIPIGGSYIASPPPLTSEQVDLWMSDQDVI